MTKKHRFARDPHAQREHANYDRPIPSREFILELFEQQQKMLSFTEVCDLLELKHEDDMHALGRRLNAMQRDGQLMSTRGGRYGLIKKTDLLIGEVQAFKDGHGFVVCESDHPDIYLSAYQMRTVMHGDKVLVNVVARSRQGSQHEGVVVEVLKRAHDKLVGRLAFGDAFAYVEIEHKKLFHEVIIPPGEMGDAHEGQMVEVEVTQYPTAKQPAMGKVVAILGEYMAPGMEIEVAKRVHQLPFEWPQTVLEEVKSVPKKVRKQDLEGRVDLRDKPFVTIDGADAKDFDDAVFAQATDDGQWRLYVAIADVATYVEPNSALDIEAKERGNSVYFPNHVIPMLPEQLSNGICSLKPNVDRLCMVCEMLLDTSGDMLDYKFYEGVMHSHARFTYDQVADIIEGENPDLLTQCAHLLEHVYALYGLYELLLAQRRARGCIEFETTETKIIFGKKKKIDSIEPVTRRVSHRMIEECMLAANIAAADMILKHQLPALFRNHDTPPSQKLIDFRKFISDFSLQLSGGEEPTPRDFSHLIEQLEGRDEKSLVETVMLRTMSQAKYSAENEGHFGLAFEAYSHFTSPIRRYPDLLLHRAIKGYLQKSKKKVEQSSLQAMAEHCSMTERRADEATRDVINWLKCEFMQSKVGETYTGIITAVTSFGIFVQLNDIYIEGLVHISALGQDYYHYDSERHLLFGEFSGEKYRLGDRVEVIVARVDMDDRKIDFSLANAVEELAPKAKKKKKRVEQRRSKKAKRHEKK